MDELFRPYKVVDSEREKISSPNTSMYKEGWIRLKKNKAAVVCLVILSIVVALAIFGPMMTPYTYSEQNYDMVYQAPSKEHWFGTDKFGRDLWERVWQGTRVSLLIAVMAACLDLFVGVTYGAFSAIKGGKTDIVMQRILEILMGVPSIIIVILLMMFMKAGIFTVMIAIGIISWVNMAKLVRAQILKLKEQEFVLAARVLGTSQKNIIMKHLIPNTVGVIVINTMFTIPSAIFTEAFLSFIGLGLRTPMASLGTLINDGFQSISTQPYLFIFPAAVIIILMVTFSIVGDGLRDALDPRFRK